MFSPPRSHIKLQILHHLNYPTPQCIQSVHTNSLQRIRDAIDTRIAEEQARQKTAQENLSRSASARRPNNNSNNLSPGQRSRQRRHSGTPVRGPDPKEFEAEFAIGDDESDSRAGTPRVETPDASSEVHTADGEGAEDAETKEDDNKTEGKAEKTQADKKNGKAASTATDKSNSKEDASAADAGSADQASAELPAEIKGKLRRMDKLESRYRGMS